MTIQELCKKIELQPEAASEVLDFCSTFDFSSVNMQIDHLMRRETEAAAREQLAQLLGEDEHRIKMLSCMLFCAVRLYGWYQEKGISEQIFLDTMKCFPRFIGECRVKTGQYAFDREWWTSRQVGGRLFRIGELEYELDVQEDSPAISIHIPSDADLTPENCDNSLKQAREFFAAYIPEYTDVPYICESWLLAPCLKELLPESSKILKFQSRFCITDIDPEPEDYLEWVYRVHSCSIEQLPERTSLQRNMKQYLLEGGKIGTAFGLLKEQEDLSI